MDRVRRRTKGFTLIELMITVAIIGILAAVAIPAFIKYTYRSRTVEATMNLRAMYDGAVSYYQGEHADSSGNILAKQFPSNSGPTPALLPGLNAGDIGVKHKPVVAEWSTDGWTALDFQIDDWYSFQYSFLNSGAAPTPGAFMTAHADLNGNTIQSTFQRYVQGNHDQVQGGQALYTYQEIE